MVEDNRSALMQDEVANLVSNREPAASIGVGGVDADNHMRTVAVEHPGYRPIQFLLYHLSA